MPKSLKIEKAFTISVRIFNPCPRNLNFHTLLQSTSGLGGLFVIDSESNSLGCFTENGKWIDSGINLNSNALRYKWLNVLMSYSSSLNHSKLNFYLDGELVKSYHKEKILFPNNIQYIGNCKDLVEPFGAFCDLRVYPYFLDEIKIMSITSGKNLYSY